MKNKYLSNSNNTGKPKFLTFGAKKAFNCLKETFTKALIFRHFDLECYIWIKTNTLGYAIEKVLSQLISNQLTSDENIKSSVDWHPMIYFSRKMIPAETWYKTYDNEFLTILEMFKTCWHYFKSCKHEYLVLTHYNNLCQFIDIKSLSSRQVHWAQKLSCYHFQINYHQGKVNKAANTLSQYLQQSAEEKKIIRAKNIKIFYRL